MDIEEVRLYFQCLISAVEYCHECAQVIHRDIKCENILLDEKHHLKLADFGVSSKMKQDGDDILTQKAGT
jgi:serine/threonine protein kinase